MQDTQSIDPRQTAMSFEDALKFLKANSHNFAIRRADWNSKDVYVCVHNPAEREFETMTQPFLYIEVPAGSTEQFQNGKTNCVPWRPRQSDLFSNKWEIKRLS